jgi:hypothetical protein
LIVFQVDEDIDHGGEAEGAINGIPIAVALARFVWRLYASGSALSGPALECMSECTHLVKAKQPRNLRYM